MPENKGCSDSRAGIQKGKKVQKQNNTTPAHTYSGRYHIISVRHGHHCCDWHSVLPSPALLTPVWISIIHVCAVHLWALTFTLQLLYFPFPSPTCSCNLCDPFPPERPHYGPSVMVPVARLNYLLLPLLLLATCFCMN